MHVYSVQCTMQKVKTVDCRLQIRFSVITKHMMCKQNNKRSFSLVVDLSFSLFHSFYSPDRKFSFIFFYFLSVFFLLSCVVQMYIRRGDRTEQNRTSYPQRRRKFTQHIHHPLCNVNYMYNIMQCQQNVAHSPILPSLGLAAWVWGLAV